MKKSPTIYVIGLIIFCSTTFFSCNESEKKITLKKITFFESEDDNQDLLVDLLGYRYNYIDQIAYELTTTDTNILKNIKFDHTKPGDSCEFFSINVTLSNEASSRSEEILPILQRMINENIELHTQRFKTINLALEKALDFSKTIQSESFEKWKDLSGNELLKSNSEFNELIKYKAQKDLKGTRELLGRKTFNDEDLNREVYAIYFKYESDIYEHITLAFEVDSLKVIGYTIHYPNK